jgi:hypothetical protein
MAVDPFDSIAYGEMGEPAVDDSIKRKGIIGAG